MRKLLLTSTALVAATITSANYALADVSISGFYEWSYQSRSSNITANDGTNFDNDSEITFSFSNETDSGLKINMDTIMESDDADTDIKENSLSIEGGFGKVVLGGTANVGDSYGLAGTDLIEKEAQATGTDSLELTKADIAEMEGDANKIAYHLPNIGGLTSGISFADSGANSSSDTTAVGVQYEISTSEVSITLGGATATTENSTQDIDSQNIGVKIVMDKTSLIVSQASYEASSTDENAISAGVSYSLTDDLTLGLHTTEVEDDISNEEYTNTGVEIQYSIASGLTAFLNVEDYDYKVGTSSGTTADSGTVSKFTIEAAF